MSENGSPEVVVVTGASAGVGRAVAHAFAKRGAHLGLLARGEEGLEGARREVESFGGKALVLPTDVADHEQVEAAAAAVAVEHKLGPIDVGGSAVKAIVGNKLAPRLADWYLARTGFETQQVEDMPVEGRRDNLFEPVPDEAATHGMFDDRAHEQSYQLWANTHRGLVAGAFAAIAGAAGLARLSRR